MTLGYLRRMIDKYIHDEIDPRDEIRTKTLLTFMKWMEKNER